MSFTRHDPFRISSPVVNFKSPCKAFFWHFFDNAYRTSYKLLWYFDWLIKLSCFSKKWKIHTLLFYRVCQQWPTNVCWWLLDQTHDSWCVLRVLMLRISSCWMLSNTMFALWWSHSHCSWKVLSEMWSGWAIKEGSGQESGAPDVYVY